MAAPVVPSEASKDAVEKRQRFPELCGLDQASRPHDGAAVCDARHALPPFPSWLKAGGGFSAEKIPDDKQRG
ncbi:hypothetical protein HYQ46_005734 [Verticillium longisporum]|nr:hypothetical protein HYQ46_005734 [Verticillium longisporum]